MKTRLKFLSLLCVCLFSNIRISATSVITLSLNHKDIPTPTDNHKPSRSPLRYVLDIYAYLDLENHSILFINSTENTFEYEIINNNEDTIVDGILNFNNTESIAISIASLSQGTYTLKISVNDITYTGSFEIE